MAFLFCACVDQIFGRDRFIGTDFGYRAAFLAQACKIGTLMLDAFFLQQLGVQIILGQGNRLHELPQVAIGRVGAAKIVDEIGRRINPLPSFFPHFAPCPARCLHTLYPAGRAK